MRADRWLASASEAPRLVVVGVPFATSGSSAWLTPERLRTTLIRFSTYDGDAGVELGHLAVRDDGDWPVPRQDPEGWAAWIERAAGRLPLVVAMFVGGDSAITGPLVRGLAGPAGLGGAGVLMFGVDHGGADQEEGDSAMHGLIEEGLPDGRVVRVGAHSFSGSSSSREYCTVHDIEVVTMETVDAWGIVDTVEWALDRLSGRCEWIFVEVDMAVLDPAYAPACSDARPGGMTPRQLGAAARLCGIHPKVRAAAFVDVDDADDPGDLTVMNLANTMLAFASGVAQRRQTDV